MFAHTPHHRPRDFYNPQLNWVSLIPFGMEPAREKCTYFMFLGTNANRGKNRGLLTLLKTAMFDFGKDRQRGYLE